MSYRITRALSIRQPWPWAIFHPELRKDIENRTWPTRFRGRFAVHTSKDMKRHEYLEGLEFMEQVAGAYGKKIARPAVESLPLGAIVGTVDLVACVCHSGSAWFMGEWGFVLRNPMLFRQPVPCSGAQGFWYIPDDKLRAVNLAYEDAILIAA